VRASFLRCAGNGQVAEEVSCFLALAEALAAFMIIFDYCLQKSVLCVPWAGKDRWRILQLLLHASHEASRLNDVLRYVPFLASNLNRSAFFKALALIFLCVTKF
jgi:hypothetical protein